MTLKCIIGLLIVYFAIYTASEVLATRKFYYPEAPGAPQSKLERALDSASLVIDAAPMFCVLFLATRERAIQLAGMEPTAPVPALLQVLAGEVVELPADWVQKSMAVGSICLALCAAVTAPLIKAETPTQRDGTDEGTPLLTLLHNLLRATRNCAIILVLVGLLWMNVPGQDGPDFTNSAKCIVSLTVQYFVMNTLCEIVLSLDTLNAAGKSKLQKILESARKTVDYAPMLCVLFMVARMRADIVTGGVLQDWAIRSFYICTYVLLAQTILAVVVPYALGLQPKERASGEIEIPGDVRYADNGQGGLQIINFLRWACIIALHVCMIMVVVSIFTIEDPNKAEGAATPPLSATARCVTGLASLYFLLHVIQSALLSLSELGADSLMEVIKTVKGAIDRLKCLPMLCVLCIGTRLRALTMTQNKGAPQGWVQDC